MQGYRSFLLPIGYSCSMSKRNLGLLALLGSLGALTLIAVLLFSGGKKEPLPFLYTQGPYREIGEEKVREGVSRSSDKLKAGLAARFREREITQARLTRVARLLSQQRGSEPGEERERALQLLITDAWVREELTPAELSNALNPGAEGTGAPEPAQLPPAMRRQLERQMRELRERYATKQPDALDKLARQLREQQEKQLRKAAKAKKNPLTPQGLNELQRLQALSGLLNSLAPDPKKPNPSEAQLRKLYREGGEAFRRPARLSFLRLSYSSKALAERALRALEEGDMRGAEKRQEVRGGNPFSVVTGEAETRGRPARQPAAKVTLPANKLPRVIQQALSRPGWQGPVQEPKTREWLLLKLRKRVPPVNITFQQAQKKLYNQFALTQADLQQTVNRYRVFSGFRQETVCGPLKIFMCKNGPALQAHMVEGSELGGTPETEE